MKKIITILGARPQFIKSKPLSDIFKKRPHIREIIVHTGQHYDYRMSEIFYRELRLSVPRYHLNVNQNTNIAQVALMVKKLEAVITREKPVLVIVYGDTNSTLAGALSAKMLNCPLAHIEAGLRSFRMDMPEELNRVITDRISNLLFAPVQEAIKNLEKEKLADKAYLVGDVLCDVLDMFRARIDMQFRNTARALNIKDQDYLFLTLHRSQTVDDALSLRLALKALSRLKQKVIFSVHPRTAKMIKEHKLDNLLGNICPIAPQPYIVSLAFIKHAKLVLTDSGGVQREAYMLKTPCVTLRQETEWNETCKLGWNRLVEINQNLLNGLPRLLERMQRPQRYERIFGDGNTAEKIFRIIEKLL
ncbi:MAG: UDP-N-acetylglucosamine 2-epimerase (non-hydrolyzing) [Candidatus Omnitrophica bacterium]|nr:UDP-N-acetylglucosamine 2-epimerase (non-hydrolyzing) [Candidatus Omnitrophota bacterium]